MNFDLENNEKNQTYPFECVCIDCSEIKIYNKTIKKMVENFHQANHINEQYSLADEFFLYLRTCLHKYKQLNYTIFIESVKNKIKHLAKNPEFFHYALEHWSALFPTEEFPIYILNKVINFEKLYRESYIQNRIDRILKKKDEMEWLEFLECVYSAS